jgi:hypothetical protein
MRLKASGTSRIKCICTFARPEWQMLCICDRGRTYFEALA